MRALLITLNFGRLDFEAGCVGQIFTPVVFKSQAQNKSCQNELIQEIITPSKSKQVDNINGFVVKLDAIPNQLSIISSQTIDCDFPCINLKILDFL